VPLIDNLYSDYMLLTTACQHVLSRCRIRGISPHSEKVAILCGFHTLKMLNGKFGYDQLAGYYLTFSFLLFGDLVFLKIAATPNANSL